MSDAVLTSDDSVAMASVSAPRKRQKRNNRGGSGDDAAYTAMKFRIVINNQKKEILQLEKEKADLSARLARVEKMLEKIAGPNIDWADDVPTISMDEEMATEVTPSAKNAHANNIASAPPQGLPDKWVCSIHGNNEDVPTSRQVDELKSTKAAKSSGTALLKNTVEMSSTSGNAKGAIPKKTPKKKKNKAVSADASNSSNINNNSNSYVDDTNVSAQPAAKTGSSGRWLPAITVYEAGVRAMTDMLKQMLAKGEYILTMIRKSVLSIRVKGLENFVKVRLGNCCA